MEKVYRYKVICIMLAIILIAVILGKIGLNINNKLANRSRIKQEICSILNDEEIKEVNMKELLDDITSGIKHAKHVEKKGSPENWSTIPDYEGDGYTIINNGGGEFICYSYYCGDKLVYTYSIEVPFESVKETRARFFKENKNEIIYFCVLIFIAITEIIFFSLYRKQKNSIK